ncbi:MAG TPA: PKD domain-containing protein [Verrucomicrobiae bacterium]|nr:PKD domain-containing protein [Verrucomicrobiae bacterium]
MNFTVFDPLLNRWQPTNSGWFLADNVTLRVQPGVVFWEAEINGGSIARFSTYDPNLQAWQTTNSLLLGTTTLGFYGHGGVLYWIENPRRMVAAVYDPVLQRWVTLRGSSIIEGDSIIPVCDQGIVVLYERFDSPQRWYVHCWIFDPLRHEWRTVRLGPYTTSTGLVRIEQGSIRLFIGSQTPLKGYNYISGTWGDGATLPLALFHTSKRDGLAPLGVWFTDLSLGAAQWNWSFGDGSQSTNRSPYHVFQQPGSNSVTLTISGLGGGGSTNALINSYSPPRLQMLGASNGFYQLQLFAQPNSVHLLEQSSNLIDWTLIRWLTNSSGATLIEDAMLSEPSSSFFRSKQISP